MKHNLRFFTLKTIKELFINNGYKIEYISFDQDKGIPKHHSLFLKLPNGWKNLKKILFFVSNIVWFPVYF